MKKRVCILHTGGTIGMVCSPHGYETCAGRLRHVLEELPELQHDGMPDTDLVEMTPLLDSSNIALPEWNRIGGTIAEKYDAYDGFVVLHGTDTMAYTASALAFQLQNLGKPVVLTGSQIPFGELRTDARDNLLTSLLLAAGGEIREVCLYFGGRLLRGVRSTKVSADALIAFDSPNYPPLAECGIEICVRRKNLLPPPEEAFRFTPFVQHSIAVFKVFPGIRFGMLEAVVSGGLKGLVLEAFGSGNMPVAEDNGLMRFLEHAGNCGTAVVVCTQCLCGSARPGKYAVSEKLRDKGIISGQDMTVEAAVAKLYALLTAGLAGDPLRREMEESLCGELTPQA